jgi:hypothetical protein
MAYPRGNFNSILVGQSLILNVAPGVCLLVEVLQEKARTTMAEICEALDGQARSKPKSCWKLSLFCRVWFAYHNVDSGFVGVRVALHVINEGAQLG